MAPPPESQLLWINKDVKSYKQSKKLSAVQAAIINAHSQQQARAARAIANQRGLRDSSAVKAIVGWKQRSVSSTSRSSPTKDQSSEEFESCLTEDSERNPKKLEFMEFIVGSRLKGPPDNLLPFIPYICGKDEALDPFNCTAAKIDSNMHKLMEFYLAQVHPVSHPHPSEAVAMIAIFYQHSLDHFPKNLWKLQLLEFRLLLFYPRWKTRQFGSTLLTLRGCVVIVEREARRRTRKPRHRVR
jgi:hypothetical protein